MTDAAFASAVLLAAVILSVAYRARVTLRGPVRSARVEREGHSPLVAKGAMEMLHWALRPLGVACVRVGLHANAVTWASLAFGVAAAAALGAGHFGVAALLTTVAAIGDALDGVVARLRHEASDAGEVLDATIDRYVELCLLSGLAFHYRNRPLVLLLTLGALGGSFMVSYATAIAGSLHVEAPRGGMRRAERLCCIVSAITFAALLAAVPSLAAWADSPVLAALSLLAVAGNASAVRRLAAVARAVGKPARSGVGIAEPVRLDGDAQ